MTKGIQNNRMKNDRYTTPPLHNFNQRFYFSSVFHNADWKQKCCLEAMG